MGRRNNKTIINVGDSPSKKLIGHLSHTTKPPYVLIYVGIYKFQE